MFRFSARFSRLRIRSCVPFLVLTVLMLSSAACRPSGESGESPIKAAGAVPKITVEPAPFDVFPESARFGPQIRFSVPIVEKGDPRLETDRISIAPRVAGTFRWSSDASLLFRPEDPLPAASTYKIDISHLPGPNGAAFSRNDLTMTLPEPFLKLNTCTLVETAKNPIAKKIRASLFFNYPIDGYFSRARFTGQPPVTQVKAHAKLTRTLDGKPEDVVLAIDLRDEGMVAELSGTEMLRPGHDGSFHLEITPGILAHGGRPFPGASCEVPFKDAEWRTELSESLADSEAKKKPEPALPLAFFQPAQRGLEPFVVRFLDPVIRQREIAHRRAAGEVVEKGISLDPAVEGHWEAATNRSDLLFIPKQSWIPGTLYTAKIDQAAFPELALKETSANSHAWLPAASIFNAESGTVPEDPKRRVVSARLTTTFPIAQDLIERAVSVSREEVGKLGTRTSLPFSIEPGRDPFTFFIKTQPLDLLEYPQKIEFSIGGWLHSTLGGDAGRMVAIESYILPSKREIFTIRSAEISVAKSSSEELQRILSITASEDVDEKALQNALLVELLPDCADNKKNGKLCEDQPNFSSEQQVTSLVQQHSTKIPLTFISRTDGPGEITVSFAFQAPGEREIFVEVAKGLSSKLAFTLDQPYREVAHLVEYPKRLSVMLDGSLLSLSGSKRLGILAQNVHKVGYRLSKIKATDLHHLVYLTYGTFKQPALRTTFTFDDMAQPSSFFEELPNGPSGKPVYTSVDFTKFLSKDKDLPHGLFYLEVFDAERSNEAPESSVPPQSGYEDCDGEETLCPSAMPDVTQDARIVLLTDLGMIVKRSLQGDDVAYVASFRKGLPVSGATVKLLARNGSVLFSAVSDKDGSVTFPRALDFKREKQPVVYTAEKDGDLTFLPYERRDRQVNFSRSDVGGVVNASEPDALRALLFTDRGIYRPGELARFGAVVRQRDFSGLPAELPLTFRIFDPKGETAERRVLAVPKSGVTDTSYQTSEARTTGTYRAELVIPAHDQLPDQILTQVVFRVEEFEPDRLSIATSLGEHEEGMFKKLQQLSGRATVKNLFGLAAAGNTVKAQVVVDPWSGFLPQYPGYSFRPTLEYQARSNIKLDLGELTTDANGQVSFGIAVPDVNSVVLEGSFTAEAFEKESGRSVATTSRALLTDLTLFVGVKSNDMLEFIQKGAARTLRFQGIDLHGAAVEAPAMTVSVEKEEYRNVLVKQANGIFKYESAKKLLPVSKTAIDIAVEGYTFSLDTGTPGTFLVSLRDAQGVLLNQVRYTVMGESNDSVRINRNANLEVTLDKPSYVHGDTVEVSIRAPYAGFGVITVEREKVLSTQWFQMTGTTSVQKIIVPKGIVGNAYITVMLARAWGSKEIYLPPLTSASVPLAISEQLYAAPPKLDIPKEIRPGETAKVHYTVAEAGSLVVYAVDEGILQFGKYRAPDPLKTLLPKRALEVETRSALDLVMPDFSVVQSVLAPSGDAGADLAKYQNPFKKKNRPPVAYWSGVLSVAAGSGDYEVSVPDTFDGGVKVFALFVSDRRVGFSQGRAEVRGDFVLRPNLPSFVAPGDEFELGVEVTNTQSVEHEVEVDIQAPELTLVSEGRKTLKLPAGAGQVALFRAKAQDLLGAASVRFSAQSGSLGRSLTESYSIRPASPLMRTVTFGAYDPENPKDSPEKKASGLREMYAPFRQSTAGVSLSPGLLVDMLNQYMEGYPYGCSEQLTSKGIISLVLLSYTENGEKAEKLRGDVRKTLQILASRMNGSGGLGYWSRSDGTHPFASVYAHHFAIDAMDRGFEVPSWYVDDMKRYLTATSKANAFELSELYTQAYALYLRARLGETVTPELNSMTGRLQAVESKKWKGTALSWLIASTYAQLQMNDKAKEYAAPSTDTSFGDMPFPWNDPVLHAGIINYLRARHFTEPLSKDMIFSLLNRLENESPTSLRASAVALGLAANAVTERDGTQLSITSNTGTNNTEELPLTGQLIHLAQVPAGSGALTFRGDKAQHFFYSLVESGFDRKPALQGSRTQGLSLARDLVNAKGDAVSTLKRGETYHVILRVQSDRVVKDFAVQDLLPAGFEPDLEALRLRRSVGNETNAWRCDNVDVRDDRLLLFGTLSNGTLVFSYPVKPTLKGTFVWPGLYGEAMYNARLYGWENAATVTVE